MSTHQYTLKQGWKCPKHTTGKAQSSESHIRMITHQYQNLIKGIPSHAFFLQLFSPKSTEETRLTRAKRFFLGKKASERIQQPMTNYNQPLKQPETDLWLLVILVSISSHAYSAGHSNHTSATLEPPESTGCHPASQGAEHDQEHREQ